jgi:hypothetical protein
VSNAIPGVKTLAYSYQDGITAVLMDGTLITGTPEEGGALLLRMTIEPSGYGEDLDEIGARHGWLGFAVEPPIRKPGVSIRMDTEVHTVVIDRGHLVKPE